jgi:hypothetical protein
MSSSRTMRSTPIRRQRRGRLWQLRPVVLPRGTGRCTITTLPTCLTNRSSIDTSGSSSSWLLAHLSAHTSRQHPRSTSTSAYVVPACTTNRWSCLWPHMLQLWSLGPLRSRVPCAKEERRLGPRHSPTTWSSEGGRRKDRPQRLHHYEGHS